MFFELLESQIQRDLLHFQTSVNEQSSNSCTQTLASEDQVDASEGQVDLQQANDFDSEMEFDSESDYDENEEEPEYQPEEENEGDDIEDEEICVKKTER